MGKAGRRGGRLGRLKSGVILLSFMWCVSGEMVGARWGGGLGGGPRRAQQAWPHGMDGGCAEVHLTGYPQLHTLKLVIATVSLFAGLFSALQVSITLSQSVSKSPFASGAFDSGA